MRESARSGTVDRCLTAAKTIVSYRHGRTGLEYRPSRRTKLDGSGRSAQADGLEGRARYVPDQVVGQGSSRSFTARLASSPTCVAARSVRGR
jgi:hypothetical protein